MKKHGVRKLELNRETLLELADRGFGRPEGVEGADLKRVVGGGPKTTAAIVSCEGVC